MKQTLMELQGEIDNSTVYRNYNNSYLLINSTNKKSVVL